MNRRMVFFLVGQILKAEAALLALPLIVSLLYKESGYLSFLITIGIALVLGFGLTLISRPKNKVIYATEGFVVVALAWLVMSAIGALPFVISGSIPSYVDALFETVSGFTTTGSSLIPDVESLEHGILFWRSFTHRIGGIGVLVFVLAVMLISMITTDYFYGIIASLVSGFFVNYFFMFPYSAFSLSYAGYPIAMLSMMTISIVVCFLTSRVKKMAIDAVRREQQTNALYKQNQ